MGNQPVWTAFRSLHHVPQPAHHAEYVSSRYSQIAGDGGGKTYPTFFFVNGPYNPNRNVSAANPTAATSTQFCRQCHFNDSNEANNTNTVPTLLQN
jgi:hypothetical protein